jgi:hypothetical protein
MATLQGIYIALFGRPADPLGLAFFNNATNNGADLTAIGDLAATAEYQGRFEGMSSAQIVTAIYQALFARNPEPAGLAFFIDQLDSGAQGIATIAINMLDGAQNDDALVAANKIEAANTWMAAIAADPDALAAYQGQSGILAGADFLSGITADRSTIPTATQLKAAIVTLIAAIEPAEPDPEPEPGQIFTLTEDSGEVVDGTDSDDTYIAILGADRATLNDDDRIDGRGGLDALNLVVTANVAIPDTASIENVEIINLDQSSAVVRGLTATSFVGATEIWQINTATGISDLGSGQTAGFRDTGDVRTALGFTGESGEIALQLGINGGFAGFEVHGANLTTLAISGSMEFAGGDKYLPLEITDAFVEGNATLSNLSSVTISMSTNTELDFSEWLDGAHYANFRTIDATGSSGGIAMFLESINYLESIRFGSGSDMLYLDTDYLGGGFGGLPLNIDLGAGDDFVIAWLYDNGAANVGLNITLGAGFDTFAIFGYWGQFENIRDASGAEYMNGIVRIFGFDANEDVIVMDGSVVDDGFFRPASFEATLKVLADPDRTEIEDENTLFTALERAAEFADGGVVTFKFNGSTYIYNDSSELGAFDGGDGLIELVGFTDTLTVGENFRIG